MKAAGGHQRAVTAGLLLAFALLGAGLRLAYLADFRRHADFDTPKLDAKYHRYWAHGLATGDWAPPAGEADPELSRAPFFRPPGYPAFLGLVFRAVGPGNMAPRLAQMALGVANVLLAFGWARPLFGRRVALLLALAMTVYWSFIYFEGEWLEPVLLITLHLLLMTALTAWTRRGTWTRGVAAGVCMGLLVLTRPTALPFVPVAVLWGAWVLRRAPTRGPLLKTALGFLLATALVVGTVTVRNYRAARELCLVSANGGINLFFGNSEYADGYTPYHPAIGDWNCFDYPGIVRRLEKPAGAPPYRFASAWFAQQAGRFVRVHPAAALRLTLRKALLFWGPLEVSNEKEDEVERRHAPVLRYVPGSFSTVFSLALAGLWFFSQAWLQQRRGAPAGPVPVTPAQGAVMTLAVAYALTYFAAHVPFIIAGRYRVPLVPLLMLPAAWGVRYAWELARQRDVRRLQVAGLVWLLAWALATRNAAGYQPNIARWHYDRGVVSRMRGETAASRAAFAEALKLNPEMTAAHLMLGRSLAESGDAAGARQHFEAILRTAPDHFMAYYYLGVLEAQQGQWPAAVARLERALALDPGNPLFHARLGSALAAAGQTGPAEFHLRKALRAQPGDADAWAELAGLMRRRGDYRAAADGYRRALQLEPDRQDWQAALAALPADNP